MTRPERTPRSLYEAPSVPADAVPVPCVVLMTTDVTEPHPYAIYHPSGACVPLLRARCTGCGVEVVL